MKFTTPSHTIQTSELFVDMAGKNGCYYDAFSTLKILSEVLADHDELQKELTPVLKDIKTTMREASSVPLEASDKPATSSKIIIVVR